MPNTAHEELVKEVSSYGGKNKKSRKSRKSKKSKKSRKSRKWH